MTDMEKLVLKSLAKQYPSIASASTEIINLQSILNLPKGTEHFLTDLHGEFEQFQHVLKNGSGSVRRKIEEEFGNAISQKDKRSLATLMKETAIESRTTIATSGLSSSNNSLLQFSQTL